MSIKIEGMEDLQKTLGELLPRESRNILRRTVTKIAAGVRNDMRRAAHKDTGVLRKAIVSKRDRGTPDSVEASVWVTHGPGAKHDAFYWHMEEFGSKGKSAHPFINPTVEAWRPKIYTEYRAEFGRQLEKEMAKRK